MEVECWRCLAIGGVETLATGRCAYCGAMLAPVAVPAPFAAPFPIRAPVRQGETLQQAAAALCFAAGVLLLLAVPLTLSIVQTALGLPFEAVASRLGVFLVCAGGIHVILAVGAFWAGYRGVKFLMETGGTILAIGIASILAALFLLGGLLGLVAGALLITAGALVYMS